MLLNRATLKRSSPYLNVHGNVRETAAFSTLPDVLGKDSVYHMIKTEIVIWAQLLIGKSCILRVSSGKEVQAMELSVCLPA